MIENLREDFLKRELEKLCGHEFSSEQVFEGDITSPVVYTQTDFEVENGLEIRAEPASCQEKSADAFKILNEKTLTMFAGSP